MVLTTEELAPTKTLLETEGVVGEDTFIVAIVHPRSPPKEPRRTLQDHIPQKALTNLVSDLCASRYELIFARVIDYLVSDLCDSRCEFRPRGFYDTSE